MTLRKIVGLRLLCAVLLWSPCVPAIAEDSPSAAGGFAKPSVEELAIPKDQNKAELQKSETAGDTDTREAICLMIESAAKSQDLPLEFSRA